MQDLLLRAKELFVAAALDGEPTKLDFRFSPTGTYGLLLAAEPALTLALINLGLVIVTLSRHVVDVLAFGVDVALD